jgi:hypothetical protein
MRKPIDFMMDKNMLTESLKHLGSLRIICITAPEAMRITAYGK